MSRLLLGTERVANIVGIRGEHKSRMLYDKLPRQVEDQLSKVHIEKVWELLGKQFGFNVKEHKKEFREYFLKQPHQISESEAFVDYGIKFIGPLLNRILKRHEHHPTWTNLLRHIVEKY